ncbi:MAG: hypothetical protein R6V03_08510 [Kiritimatiellia bacterium]
MMAKWFPWKWLIACAAKSYGIMDPFMLLARLRKFAEPSEVDAPMELIRAWTMFQARGVVNTRAIQHNLDWVWPYWVERQFNPRDPSFVPRSFSFTHINLTQRNWTAVALPDSDMYAIVDPRGLVTPLDTGWSLDAWVSAEGDRLVPSRCKNAVQHMYCGERLAVRTCVEERGMKIESTAEMHRAGGAGSVLRVEWKAEGPGGAQLCVALRPYNPEGVQFIDSVEPEAKGSGWRVNGRTSVAFDRVPARCPASTYRKGDVFHRLSEDSLESGVRCPVGMATAAAVFPVKENGPDSVAVEIPMKEKPARPARVGGRYRPEKSWELLDGKIPAFDVPDRRMSYIYEAAARTLLVLSAGEVYPGPYTYRRFWFRDACVMLNALLALNHEEPCRRAFEHSFGRRQTVRGFFQSPQGEWDSNGQVLWLAGRWHSLSGNPMSADILKILRKGADWLCRKRISGLPGRPHRGLLPSGFSAEHFGPNNYYYWDNFWGVAGLRSAAAVFESHGQGECREKWSRDADSYEQCILDDIERIPPERSRGGIPAAPGRRMDAGAVGSLVADYPLRLFPPRHERITGTLEFLMKECMIDDGFFHDMTHSGINPYLTLHLAQVLLRCGDARFERLVRKVAGLASSTGQWPEAVHPVTLGGCMGDGQHGWAAAEWVLMMRALFVREEEGKLVIGSGLFPEWLESGEVLRFGPTPTPYGPVTVRVDTSREKPEVKVEGEWRHEKPRIEIALTQNSQQPMTNSQ